MGIFTYSRFISAAVMRRNFNKPCFFPLLPPTWMLSGRFPMSCPWSRWCRPAASLRTTSSTCCGLTAERRCSTASPGASWACGTQSWAMTHWSRRSSCELRGIKTTNCNESPAVVTIEGIWASLERWVLC